MNEVPHPALLFVAGGTGGHLFPALAVADRCRELVPDVHIEFVGSRGRMEERIVPRSGYPLNLLWISGIERLLSLRTLALPTKVMISMWQANRIIERLKPRAVVCAGAYVSYPVGVVASLRRIPLVLMESNAFPGLAIRKLARRATEIHVAFESARKHLANDEVIVSGNPVRAVFRVPFDRQEARRHFGLTADRPTLFAFGGSLGSRSINNALDATVERLLAAGVQLIWQTGTSYAGGERRDANCYRSTFVHEMERAYAAADLVLARAGATTVAELAMVGKPSVLVPLPIASVRQQENAEAMKEAGAAEIIADAGLGAQLVEVVLGILGDSDRLVEMGAAARRLAGPDADDRIARSVLRRAGVLRA